MRDVPSGKASIIQMGYLNAERDRLVGPALHCWNVLESICVVGPWMMDVLVKQSGLLQCRPHKLINNAQGVTQSDAWNELHGITPHSGQEFGRRCESERQEDCCHQILTHARKHEPVIRMNSLLQQLR